MTSDLLGFRSFRTVKGDVLTQHISTNRAASQPRAILGAHAIAGLVGYAVVQLGLSYGEAVAVVLTITLTSATKMVHPPAGAYAFLYVNKGMGVKGIFAPGLVGSAILVGSQLVFNSAMKPLIKKKKA